LKIYYDNGDEEEYSLAKLIRYLVKLYTRSVVVDSETATCDRKCLFGRNILPNPDRQRLKKILNTFVDVELLSIYTAEVSVKARVVLVADSDPSPSPSRLVIPPPYNKDHDMISQTASHLQCWDSGCRAFWSVCCLHQRNCSLIVHLMPIHTVLTWQHEQSLGINEPQTVSTTRAPGILPLVIPVIQ
jgi:hypothetical protein